MSVSKGDRLRLTVRLPRGIVEDIDAWAIEEKPHLTRNEAIEGMLRVMLENAGYNGEGADDSTPAPDAPTSEGGTP